MNYSVSRQLIFNVENYLWPSFTSARAVELAKHTTTGAYGLFEQTDVDHDDAALRTANGHSLWLEIDSRFAVGIEIHGYTRVVSTTGTLTTVAPALRAAAFCWPDYYPTSGITPSMILNQDIATASLETAGNVRNSLAWAVNPRTVSIPTSVTTPTFGDDASADIMAVTATPFFRSTPAAGDIRRFEFQVGRKDIDGTALTGSIVSFQPPHNMFLGLNGGMDRVWVNIKGLMPTVAATDPVLYVDMTVFAHVHRFAPATMRDSGGSI